MTEGPPEDRPSQEAGEPDPPAAPPENAAWDGKPGEVPWMDGKADPGEDGRPEVTNEQEESLDDDDDLASRRLRLDFPRIEHMRDMAGRDINHYYGFLREQRARGRISASDMARAGWVHVTTASDAWLRDSLLDDPVVFLRGRSGTGRRSSAAVVLARLTRPPGQVTIVEAASSLGGLPDRLEKGCGHLLDASEENWVDTITDAQIAALRQALRGSGYLVILVERDSARSLPSTVVDHEPPDPEQVAVFQLGGRLAPEGPPDTSFSRQLIAEACQVDAATKRWHGEITSPAAVSLAEAVLFAEAIWDWHERRRVGDPLTVPRVEEFRERRRYQQAADLLRRGSGADSPLRQSYAIAAAVLDGLAVSEVVEGAGELGAQLAEVEHPGEPDQRQIFAQPLARWLRHVEMTAPPADRGNRDGTVVTMPSRELSRIVIEVAWRNYDAARSPMLTWLMGLCEQHPNERVRIRAVQALAVIAKHDYALVKERVLEVWSTSDRRIKHQAAAWLLEAMVLEGTVAEKVKNLLRRWSRSGDDRKRAVAVRAYGTAIARTEPDDAVAGVRYSAADEWLSVLPELALYEMYVLGLTHQVTAELKLWMRGFPVMRERAGRLLIRISRFARPADGEPRGPYDLLWRLAVTPSELGIGVPEAAALWHMACRHESSRGAAWQMLGFWARDCRDHPELRDTFTQLAREFEKVADTRELHARLDVYRRRWAAYLDEEDQK